MIIFSIIGGILAIVATLIYLRDSLGQLYESKKISRKSLGFLRLIRGILYIIICITIVFTWVSFIDITSKKIFLSAFLIIVDFIVFVFYRRKIIRAINKMELKKKRARIKMKQASTKKKELERENYRRQNFS